MTRTIGTSPPRGNAMAWITGEYQMLDSKAIKNRVFDVIFVCENCLWQEEYTVTLRNLPEDTELNEITSQLQMYPPFACTCCVADDFGIQTWTEVK